MSQNTPVPISPFSLKEWKRHLFMEKTSKRSLLCQLILKMILPPSQWKGYTSNFMVNLTTFLVDLIIFYLVWANQVVTFRNYMYITTGHKFIFLKKFSQWCSSYIWKIVCLTPKLKCPSIGTEAVLVNRKSGKAQQLKWLIWTEFVLSMNWAYVLCKNSKFSYNISCVFFYLFIFFLQFPWQFKLFTF